MKITNPNIRFVTFSAMTLAWICGFPLFHSLKGGETNREIEKRHASVSINGENEIRTIQCGTQVHWIADPSLARKVAAKQKILVFELQLSGNLENDQFT